ncbi:glycoside hydrolase family 3 N-terminal domain-containing protein [Haloarchaeobius sp. HME9146]|uniref:glycoside hydrolase family 3 N-terminal domain-containing protein n=1 Tax=Haloarchaeobius sp. HME9146 TaxID=2978732 RepID=UPI0021C1B696|nr:glycoside hydrolase family 3 N-terminal domain-containing protein [Haloarchaeobius sp. HME9146]MCT9098283.1 glycoside hydrolase family 3 C-terminal domain-containing protein [Haloarchaeobius sp. HME9146]
MTTHDSQITQTQEGETEARVETLLDEMTIREKAAQLAGTYVGTMGETRTVEDAEEMVRDHGLGFVTPFGYGASPHRDSTEVVEIANELQRVAREESRLGIPILIPVDAIHGNAYVEDTTIFPHNLGVAAARDRDLSEQVGAVTATEVAATGSSLTYGPTCDVGRDPRWGRTFETFGESPYLVGELAAAKVRGIHDAPVDVAAMAKHFPAYGEPERGEDTAPVDRSLSSLYRDFIPSFEKVIDEGVEGIMPSYNSINGEPSHGSRRWLTDVLRDEFGFDGYVASDWNGINMLHDDHRVATTSKDAIHQSFDAGVDVHSLGEVDHIEHIADLVESGVITEDAVDESVRRVLELKAELGLFEDPFVDPTESADTLGKPTHQQVSLEAARKSMTLLKNDDDRLPFDADTDEILVTGPNADSLVNQVGGWSLKEEHELSGATIRDGIEELSSAETTVNYERGSGTDEPGDIDAAVEAAESSDAAVVVLGENWYIHEFGPQDVTGPTEDFPNRAELTLPDAQRELLEAVLETGTPTALVLVTGRPLAIPWAAENVDAILQAYYPGAQGGRAVAETLFGENNPAGKLPISVPRSESQLPVRHNHLPNPTPIGEGEHLPSYDPLFAFGHGLSYTEFEYGELSVSDDTLAEGESVSVSVTLENTGDRAGDEVVQLFAGRDYSTVVTPVKELVGFERVTLEPGEETTVTFEVTTETFDVVHPDGASRFEPGKVSLWCESTETSLEVVEQN